MLTMGEKIHNKEVKRLSPHLGSDPLEIRNTGLRPNWHSFWALEMSSSDLPARPGASLVSCKSALSGGTGIRHVRLITGSEWIGEWDRTGMSGMGMYKMPHGVIYEGTMKAGLFEGIGVLKYPNGSFLEGLWYGGKLKYWQFDYADGLERDCQDWTYCSMPDRRFFSEHVGGFRPANTEQLTNDHPAREIPPGHYDVGMGFYNPKSRCVVDSITGEVLSIPTNDEVKWILERCRSAESTETVGYRPDLYENWFTKPPSQQKPSEVRSEDSQKEYGWHQMYTPDSVHSQVSASQGAHDTRDDVPHVESSTALCNAEKEMLTLLQQEGGKMHPMYTPYASHRKYSLHERLENEQGQDPLRVASFEGLLKRILREIESQKHTAKSSDDSGRKTDTISNESNLFMLTQIISAYADSANRKKTASSSLGSGGAQEQFRILGKLLPSFSLTMTKQFPFSYPAPDTTVSLDSSKIENNESGSKNKSEESMLASTNYETAEQDS